MKSIAFSCVVIIKTSVLLFYSYNYSTGKIKVNSFCAEKFSVFSFPAHIMNNSHERIIAQFFQRINTISVFPDLSVFYLLYLFSDKAHCVFIIDFFKDFRNNIHSHDLVFSVKIFATSLIEGFHKSNLLVIEGLNVAFNFV